MATEEQAAAFRMLMKAWKHAFQEMRATEQVCRDALARSAQGGGPGATPEQIAAAEKASELEAKLSKELNQLAENMKASTSA